MPQLNTDVTGIIAEVKGQLSHSPVSELDAKLQAIGFFVGFYVDLIMNRHEVLDSPGTSADLYRFEVIVAGYDVDGMPKLKKLILTPLVERNPDGHRSWSHTMSPELPTVSHG